MRRLMLSLVIAPVLLLGLLMLVQAQIPDEPVVGQVTTSSGKALASQADGLNLTYTVTVTDPASHLVHIELNISSIPTGTLKLARQKVEVIPDILNLVIIDQEDNEITYSLNTSVERFELIEVEVSETSTITVIYDADLSFTDNGSGYSYWVLDYAYGLVESQLIFYQPFANTSNNSVQINFDLPGGWNAITRFQDDSDHHRPDPDDVVILDGPIKTFFFIWGPMAFGDFDIYTRTVGGIEVINAFYSEDDNLERDCAEGNFAIVDYASRTLGSLPEGTSQPRLFYAFHNRTHGHVFSRDHILGNIGVHDADFMVEWRGQAHLIFHNWFMHSFELPLWRTFHTEAIFVESAIQYYALKSTLETELWSELQVNEHLLGWYNDYVDYILGTEYDVPLASDGWGSFPNDPLPSLYNYGVRNIFWYEKAPLVLHLLNWKIEDDTQGEKSLDDVWRLLFSQFPGYPNFRGRELNTHDVLEAVNAATAKDFSGFFDAYFFGNAPLPFSIVDDTLTVDSASVPDAARLSELELVRLSVRWYEGQTDADGDGLADYIEGQIGTNSQQLDTDEDGLGDREEFGVVVDGRVGEYSLAPPLIEDPQDMR